MNAFMFALAFAREMNMFTSVTKGEQTRQRIVDTALALFEERGYAETTLREIADAAEISIGLTYRYFRRKEELVLALYEQLSVEVARKVKLPTGTVGERWAALERTRFKVLAPHRRTLLALVQAALDPDGELGVMSASTVAVRERWHALHRAVVDDREPALAELLYGLDLMLVIFWTQDRTTNARATRGAIDLIAKLIDAAIELPGAAGAIAELAKTFSRKDPS